MRSHSVCIGFALRFLCAPPCFGALLRLRALLLIPFDLSVASAVMPARFAQIEELTQDGFNGCALSLRGGADDAAHLTDIAR